MRHAPTHREPPDSRQTAAEWPFIAFVTLMFLVIVLRSLF
jgi:hypothetical protein